MIDLALLEKIRMLAPGTGLRKALDDIVMANIGALLFFVNNIKKYGDIIQGGFHVDTNFSPEKLYELSKMDGAVILDEEASKIFAANVHLITDSHIPTSETGMRHRTAERLAKQTDKLVVTVSQRRNTVTVYFKHHTYVLNKLDFLFAKISQALNVLEMSKESLDKTIDQIEIQELTGHVKLIDTMLLISKFVNLKRIRDETKPYIIEIGVEGLLANLQLKEIVRDIEEQLKVFVMDYSSQHIEDNEFEERLNDLLGLKDLGPVSISAILGYDTSSISQIEDLSVVPRGYRLLVSKAGIPLNIAKNVVKTFDDISNIFLADINALQAVDGIGVKRATAIMGSINTIKNRACI